MATSDNGELLPDRIRDSHLRWMDEMVVGPSIEYFSTRRSREALAAYLAEHGREDEAFYQDEE